MPLRTVSALVLFMMAALPLPAAAAMVAPVRSELGDADHNIHLVDLTPRFLDFHAAASAPGVDPEARWKVWQERYGFAAVPPTPEGQKIARRLLDEAWPKYEAALPTIRAGAAAMRPEPLAMLRAVTAVLKPASPVEMTVAAYVGAFDGNAFTAGEAGKMTVAVPVEMAEARRATVMPHEMAHAVHMLTAGLSGGWERSIATTLLQEGLAVHVSQAVTPGRDIRDYIEFSPGWWDAANAKRHGILQAIGPVLERKDSDSVFRFTMGEGPNGLEREAYAAGWWVVDHLRQRGMSLAQIARIPEAEMPAIVRRAITEMLAGSPQSAR